MRVGIIYDLFERYPWRDGEPPDADAENEPVETVDAIRGALRLLGHEPVLLGSPLDLVRRIDSIDVDVAVNISEAAHSRNREGYAPMLMEMLGIPFLGSDALTLSISLDKATTKDLAVAAGVQTPPFAVVRSLKDLDEVTLPPFPLFVKPRYEGAAKGIHIGSKVFDADGLRGQIEHILVGYGQDALVEQFIEGSEFTVALAGHAPVRAFPAMQRAVELETGIGLHALDHARAEKRDWKFTLPGALTPELEAQLHGDAIAVFDKLECRDFARVDFRVDSGGNAWFLEINPLPTFARDGTFAILAEMNEQPYELFLSEILEQALWRAMHV